MKRIEAIIRPDRVELVAEALDRAGITAFTIADVRGHGRAPDRVGEWRGVTYELLVTHKIAVTLLVDDDEVEAAVLAIASAASTGATGDGLITVSPVDSVHMISAYAKAAGTE
jgi:nitrogen regulatory protein P-II 1